MGGREEKCIIWKSVKSFSKDTPHDWLRKKIKKRPLVGATKLRKKGARIIIIIWEHGGYWAAAQSVNFKAIGKEAFGNTGWNTLYIWLNELFAILYSCMIFCLSCKSDLSYHFLNFFFNHPVHCIWILHILMERRQISQFSCRLFCCKICFKPIQMTILFPIYLNAQYFIKCSKCRIKSFPIV